jgi:hypothetical protein
MIFGIVRCEVLSAADSAIDVIPGTEAMTWKAGCVLVGRLRLFLPDRMTL